jgi:uncharacterized membrane protein
MPNSNRLSLLTSFLLMIALPLALGQAMLTSLAKLHLSPNFAILTLIAIVAGSAINIPVKRIVREQPVWSHPMAIWGLDRTLPRWTIRRRETIIAVNVGGCMIPLGIAFFQIAYLSRLGPDVAWGTTLATAITIFVCYLAARPVPGVGIVMPGFVSPAAAASAALLLVPDAAPSAAFVAGVLGPLVGADFLHIHDLIRNPRGVGVASIGGAGTFDGIVLSGILATVLA